MFEQDFCALAQGADIRFRQVEGGADVEYLLFQRAVGQVIQIEVDEVQGDAVFTAACVPVIGEAAEVADAFLGVAVDGNVDDGTCYVHQAGDGRALVDAAVEAVLCVDADDDDIAHFAVGDMAVDVVAAVDVGEVEQAAQAEVIGQAAVEQVDVGAGSAVLVGRGEALHGLFVRGARRRLVVAVAAVVVQGQRREDQRHGAGRGDGAGNRQAVQVEAECIKKFLGEFDALADAHVGGTDDGKRPFAPAIQRGEGRTVVKQAVEFFGEQVATPVFGGGEAWQVGKREELAQNRALQILTQELPLELRHGIRAVQGEIGGEDGTAGDTVHEVDFREQ